MIRVRRCIVLLLVFAACGAVLLTQERGSSIQNVNVGHEELLQVELKKEVELQTVSMEEFQRQLAHAKGFRDIFKIFLSDKNLTNSEVGDILRAKSINSYLPRATREDQYYNDEGEAFDEELADEAFKNLEEMNQHPMGTCRYPQPEIVPVRGSGKQYLPGCTILHRCRNVSGCCGNESMECGVDTIEIIEKAFIVIGFEKDGVIMDSDSLELKSFINHTTCKCKQKKGLDKCDKKCPSPFQIVRAGIGCKCACPRGSNRCRKIRSGRKDLKEADLKCIKEEKCYLPTCEYGDFNINEGRCLDVRHHRRKNHHRGRS